MANKRKNKKKQSSAVTTINNNIELDYDKLAAAIIRAHERIKEQDELSKSAKDATAKADWHRIIGYKEYPENENALKRIFHSIRNTLSILWHIIFFKEKNAKGDTATFALLKLVTSFIFSLCKWFLFVLSFVCLIATFLCFSDKSATLRSPPTYFMLSLLSFTISRVFRMAAFEIDKLTDRNYLIGILSATTCFLALIVAIIALLVR